MPRDARDSMSDGGAVGTASMAAAAARDGVDIRVGHRVQRLVTDDGRVVGVEATTADGSAVRDPAEVGPGERLTGRVAAGRVPLEVVSA